MLKILQVRRAAPTSKNVSHAKVEKPGSQFAYLRIHSPLNYLYRLVDKPALEHLPVTGSSLPLRQLVPSVTQ